MNYKRWPREILLRELKRALGASGHEAAEEMLHEVEQRLTPDKYLLELPNAANHFVHVLYHPKNVVSFVADESGDVFNGLRAVPNPDDPGLEGWHTPIRNEGELGKVQHYFPRDYTALCGAHTTTAVPVIQDAAPRQCLKCLGLYKVLLARRCQKNPLLPLD